MRILEVRDGFIKIEAEEKLPLSSFVKISYFEKSYIAQVLQVKNAGSVYNIYAKLVYLFNGVISAYDRSLPSRDASVEKFSFAEVNEVFVNKTPVTVCEFVEGDSLNLDRDFLNNLLIIADNPLYIKNITTNIAKQSVNTVIVDMQGNLDTNALLAAQDFKLPLNTESLQFIYEDCLNDATSDSKGLIKEIFADLAEYSRTVDFLPFSALKNIVDEMVEKSHIFKLLVLKNKLAKFDKSSYFAADKNEVSKLNELLTKENIVINLSKLDTQFANRYLEMILSVLAKSESDTKLFVNVSNSINKKNLKTLILNKKLSPVFITHSKFKYLNEIKSMFKNFMIEPSFIVNDAFKAYKNILTALSKEEMLFIGEASSRLPLVIKPVELIDISPAESADIKSPENTKPLSDIDSEISVQDDITEDTAELTPVEEAVNSKSKELINQLAEGVDTTADLSENIELFDDEEDVQNLTVDEDEEIKKGSFVSQSEFHTEVDTTAVIDLPQDITEIQDELPEEDNEEPEQAEQTEPDFNEEAQDIVQIEENYQDELIVENKEEENIEPLTEVVSEESAELIQEAADVNDETDIPDNQHIEEVSEEVTYSSIDLSNEDEFDEIIELDDSEISDDDILVDISKDNSVEISEEIDKEIVEDVDKVYTTMKEETISDEDLDFIDELNSDLNDKLEFDEIAVNGEIEPLEGFEEDINDDGLIEPIEEISDLTEQDTDSGEILETRNSTTPIVPVYDAEIPKEDIVVSDSFEQGDTVYHVKYGTGIVEKMIKYGTKTLYSINFDNVGRRLLDPTLTEIKKA